MKHEDVTIIIPSLHPDHHELSRRALQFCEESLQETFNGTVVVAYNGKGTDYPQGQCGAVNRAAEAATTPWLMISNNDMVYPPGWFERLTREVDTYKLLVASPNLVEPREGAPPFLTKFCGGLGTGGTSADFREDWWLDFAAKHQDHPNRPDLSVEPGFNLPFLIRRDVWNTVEGYDEAYDPWGSNSDSDLQYKIMVSGITPKRIRNCVIYHFGTTSGTFHPDHREEWEENRRYFQKKWGFERASSPEIWYRPEIPETITFKPDWGGKFGRPA